MRKFTALLLAMITVLSLSATAMILPTYAGEVTYRDVSSKHWAYESISAVTEAGLMHGKGKTAGEYFDKRGNVNAAEIYATLYRLAGMPEVKPAFENVLKLYGHSSGMFDKKWFAEEVYWAIHSGVTDVSWYIGSSDPTFVAMKIESGRVGSTVNPIDVEEDEVLNPGFDPLENATRTDVVLSLYYYVDSIGKAEGFDTSVLKGFSDIDIDNLVKSPNGKIETFKNLFYELHYDDFIAAWSWAVGTGIIEGYPDNTLGLYRKSDKNAPHKYVTRAEYAVILDRFMQYLEDIKEG